MTSRCSRVGSPVGLCWISNLFSRHPNSQQKLQPWKLTWHWKIPHFQYEIHLQMVDFPLSRLVFRAGKKNPKISKWLAGIRKQGPIHQSSQVNLFTYTIHGERRWFLTPGTLRTHHWIHNTKATEGVFTIEPKGLQDRFRCLQLDLWTFHVDTWFITCSWNGS